jgi:hypothetical protein
MEPLNLEINQGRWTINKKPLNLCSKEKKQIFITYLRMKKFKLPLVKERGASFKNRSIEVKRFYNHKFLKAYDNNLDNYPNIQNLEFIKKTKWQ